MHVVPLTYSCPDTSEDLVGQYRYNMSAFT